MELDNILRYREYLQDKVNEEMVKGLKSDLVNNAHELKMFIEYYHQTHAFLDYQIIKALKAERLRVENDLNRWTSRQNSSLRRRSEAGAK